MLFFVNGFIGQPVVQGFFVKVAQVFTFDLPLARYPAGKGNQLIVEHGVGAKDDVVPWINPNEPTRPDADYLQGQGDVPRGSNFIHHGLIQVRNDYWLRMGALFGAVLFFIGSILMIDARGLPVEFWRLYRSRSLRLPPFNRATWWDTTKIAGRGTFVAALALCVFMCVGDPGYSRFYLGAHSVIVGKAETFALFLGENTPFDMWVIKYFFALTSHVRSSLCGPMGSVLPVEPSLRACGG